MNSIMAGTRGIKFLLLLVAATTLVEKSDAATYVVGDGMGWTVPSGGAASYASWAANYTFRVGDILVFNFQTGLHDVAKVDGASFNSCSSTNPTNLITVGPANVTLIAGEAYYICTFGQHCSLGQKLAINVSGASPAPSPSPPAPAPAPRATPPPSTTPTPTPAPPTPTPTPVPAPPTSTPSPAPTGGSPTPSPTPTPTPTPSPSPSSSPAPSPTGSSPPPPPSSGPSAPPQSPAPGTEPPPSPPPSSAPATAACTTILVMLVSIAVSILY